ncbi:MAG: pyridoxamine 5'-phosphate oxidase family protein [Pseudomonadota bacterium]
MAETNPIRPTDDEARTLAKRLIRGAKYGALGVRDPESGGPMVSRIAVGCAPDGTPVTLISDLSHHTKALKSDPSCSLLVGEPGPKGDPLTHPRLTVQAEARFVRQGAADYAALRDAWLIHQPKARLYVDFADFSFACFRPAAAYLNGGFGKAFVLTPADLT